MTLRQINDCTPTSIPTHRAGFVSKILEPYIKEAKRTKVHTEHRRLAAWGVAQALRDIRHLCDLMNADFESVNRHAQLLYEAETKVGFSRHNVQPRIEGVEEIAKSGGSMEKIILKPSNAVRKVQERLARIVSADKTLPPDERSQRRRLSNALRQEFMKAFGLREDTGKLAEKLYRRWSCSPLKPISGLLDHPSFFRRGKNIVIASQPYGIESDELLRWTKKVGASVTIANDWGFYFPGRANLFFVEFTPEAKDELDARIRALRH